MESDDQLLFVVKYDSDAERKRVEYLFENSEGEIQSLEGLQRIVSGADPEDIYEDLVAKVPEEQVRAYRLEPIDVDADSEQIVVEESVKTNAETTETFVEYMLSKKKATLQSSERNQYEVYTKKGRAEIRYDLQENEGGTVVRLEIDGYPPAPSFLAEFFETELQEYAASQT